MTYYATCSDAEGHTHELTGESLEEIHRYLAALNINTRVNVYDCAGFVRGWASSTNWHYT